jgi:hypothetical protein
MKTKFSVGQHVFFIISGRFIKEAVVVSSSSWFVTIRFKKIEDCIIRLPINRIFSTEEEAKQHIRPALPPPSAASIPSHTEEGKFICTRRWELWE